MGFNAFNAGGQVFLKLNEFIQTWSLRGRGGSVDNIAAFGEYMGMQQYSDVLTNTPINGPMMVRGYNPELAARINGVTNSPHGAMIESMFADAGDTNNGAGGHGLEHNIGCFTSPDGNHATNAVEIRAVDDNTNTVTVVFRCGSGVSGSGADQVTSGLAFSDASGTLYAAYGPVGTPQGGTWFQYAVTEMVSGVIIGAVPLALTATAGFCRMPTCAGTPTGIPAAGWGAGSAVYDTTGHHLWIWNGTAWESH